MNDEIAFKFKDATNLDKSSQSYQVELILELDKSNKQLVRSEVYQYQKQTEASQLVLVRRQ